jgi:hypothetical protein
MVRHALLAATAVLILSACSSETPDHRKEGERSQSLVILTRPDGSTLSFDDLTITCPPRYYDEGMAEDIVEVRSDADGLAPRFFIQVPAGSDGETFELGDDLTFDDDGERSGVALFIGEERGEWSAQREDATGRLRVEHSACSPEPALSVVVEGRLQDETSDRIAAIDVVLDVTAGQVNPDELVDPPGSTATATRPDGSTFGLAPVYADCSEGRFEIGATAGIDPHGRQPTLMIAGPARVLDGRHDLPFTYELNAQTVPALYLDEGPAHRVDSGAGATGTITVGVTCGSNPKGEVALDGVLVGSAGPVEIRGRLVFAGG